MNINIGSIAKTVGQKVVKHLPEILIGLGVSGSIVTTVLACKETTKLSGVMDDIRDDIAEVHARRDTQTEDEYSKKEYVKDLTKTYGKSAIKLAKLYSPSIATGTASVACTVAGFNIQAARLAASVAASNAALAGFHKYRKNVREELGEEVDHAMRYGVKKEEYLTPVLDKNGNQKVDKEGQPKYKKEVRETLIAIPLNSGDTFAVFSELTSTDYVKNMPEYNVSFLAAQEDYFNKTFCYRRPVIFLNEVLERLGLSKTAAGQVLGWKYEPDKRIDFGIIEKVDEDGNDYYILDFNVDPVNLLECM